MRIAAITLVCLSTIRSLAQSPADNAALLEAFSALKWEEVTTQTVPDRTIRRETALIKVESEYSNTLERIAEGEQERANKRMQLSLSRLRVDEAQTEIQRASDLLHDAKTRLDSFYREPGRTDAEKATFEGLSKTQFISAREDLARAYIELSLRKLEATKAEKAFRKATQTVLQLEESALPLEREREKWMALTSAPDPAAYDGAPIERGVVLVLFPENTAVPVIEDVLRRNNLRVRSGIADIRLFITEMTDADADDPPDVAAAAVRRVVANLAREDAVIGASPNLPIGPTVVPDPTDQQSSTVACWNWWNVCTGTAAARMLRLPAAWNFNDAIQRGRTPLVRILILDEGFEEHKDLLYQPICSATAGIHGNHVMGIIGARWDNDEGVNGGTRFATLTACAPGKFAAYTPRGMTLLMSRVIWTLHRALADPATRPRIVNVSLGYNWLSFGERTAPEIRADIRSYVAAQGAYVRALMRLYHDVIVVASAGNDCGDGCKHLVCPHEAKWSSPFNWAALAEGGGVPNIFVVESLDRAKLPSKFSCVRGQIAAPGEDVVSTLTTRDPILEERDSGLAHYGSLSGTSQAAPELTAVIGQMLAYDPNLTPQAVRNILKIGTLPRPIADAYEAMILIAPDRALHDLANLDGKGTVDKADFDLFAARLRKVEKLDGLDQDGNGVIDPQDFRYSREDLNGDNFVDRKKTSFVPTLGYVTDLQVMQAAWQDPKVDKDTLEDLLDP